MIVLLDWLLAIRDAVRPPLTTHPLAPVSFCSSPDWNSFGVLLPRADFIGF
jgi:hypothetical protein